MSILSGFAFDQIVPGRKFNILRNDRGGIAFVGDDGVVNSQFNMSLDEAKSLSLQHLLNEIPTSERKEVTPVYPKRDITNLRASLLIEKEMLDVKDALTYYRLCGDYEKLSVAILEGQLLSHEVESDYKETGRQLAIDANYEPDFKKVAQSMFDCLGDRLNPYQDLKKKYGIHGVRLEGWRDGDIID
jgi:hypothetical protein